MHNEGAIYKNKNSSGTLEYTYIYLFGEIIKPEIYKSFEDECIVSTTYAYGELFYKPNCSLDLDNIANLKAILFNRERIEIEDL
uniref:DUF4176 domain-containing protein n=1 Tax=Strongyloides papillosus TaxID=174720 RepID=A0A0N5C5Y9_STREA